MTIIIMYIRTNIHGYRLIKYLKKNNNKKKYIYIYIYTHTHTHVITLEQTAIIKQTFKVCLKILYYLSLSRLIKLKHCFNFTINCIVCL